MYEDDVHITYYDEFGAWYIYLEPLDKQIQETIQEKLTVLIDRNKMGQIVGIEILGLKNV